MPLLVEPGREVAMFVRSVRFGIAALLSANIACAAEAASAERGKDFFLDTCSMCHTAGPVQGGNQGPALDGVIGRKAATLPGFAYSEALKASGKIWNPAALDAFLANPPGFVPGTKMPINVADAQDRADLIAFLTNPK
jgi:cytochrome c